jgi:acylphosphatase
MAKETRAIIVLFTGEEPDEVVRGAIKHAIRNHADERIEIVQLGSEEIVKYLVEGVCKTEKPAKEASVVTMRTPEDEAVIYIGTQMKDELTHFNAAQFVSALSNKMAEASVNPYSEESKQFMNALFILSKEDLVISQSLLKKYKLNSQRINLIKRVYNLTASF